MSLPPELLPEIPQSDAFLSPPPPRRPYLIHALLFLLTVLTTLIVGARLQYQFMTGGEMFLADNSFFSLRWALSDYHHLLLGVPFSLSLLGILLAHEMGHFLLAVRHRVYATLPFFLPAPTPFGTFGAFIQIKSRFHSRQELFDIAIGGPIAGFVVAVPVALLGLSLSHLSPLPPDPDSAALQYPPIFHLLHYFIVHLRLSDAHPLQLLVLHPIAIAAWVGM